MSATAKQPPVGPAFTESPAWRQFGAGWLPLHGSVLGSGVSFEWHDFETREPFDWGQSFHPRTVEVCLNLEGEGKVIASGAETAFSPMTAGFYRRGERPLGATRQPGQRHQFLTIEMSFDFLKHHLRGFAATLHPIVREAVENKPDAPGVAPATRLTSRHQQLLASLRRPPVLALAQTVWYQAKALEAAAEFF